MSQKNRKAFLRDIGYEEPFDESPVEVPHGWHGGAVVNTGGNIMCRIWRTWETGRQGENTEFEVIYDVSQDASVGLQAYTWDDQYDGYTFEHTIKSRNANEQTDHEQAKIAKDLMNNHQEP